jgi:hypothetical protein
MKEKARFLHSGGIMIVDPVAQVLHDKSTRGGILTPAEQAILTQWYAELDQQDEAILARTPPAPNLPQLQAQVDAVVTDILKTTNRIQSLLLENEKLRRSIVELERQLEQKSAPQPT